MVLYTLLIGSLLVSCNKKTTPNVIKSNESFYINDYADVLLNATLWTILDYSIELYDDSSVQEYQDLNIEGAQIVVLTYQGQLGDINTTEYFKYLIKKEIFISLYFLYINPSSTTNE